MARSLSAHFQGMCILDTLLIILQSNSETMLTRCHASLSFLSPMFKKHFIIRACQVLQQPTLFPDMQMARKSQNTGLSSPDPPCCCWSFCAFSWHVPKLANRWPSSFLCVLDMVPTIWLQLGESLGHFVLASHLKASPEVTWKGHRGPRRSRLACKTFTPRRTCQSFPWLRILQ